MAEAGENEGYTQRFYPGDVDYGTKPTDVTGDLSTARLDFLIAKYGKDAVDAAKEKYDEIVNVLGGVADDPFGAIEKIITTVSSGTDECKDPGLPLPDWVRNCVTVGWLYGIPGLPLPPIPGVMGTTIGELEEGFKNIGRNVQDIFDGAETCGEDTDGDGVGNELCTWGEAIGRLGEWIVGKAEDAVDAVTDPDDIGDWISGILGPVLGGLVFTEVGDQISDILFPIDTPKGIFDCASVNREGGMVIDEGSCEGCMEGFTPNEDGQCVPGECPPEMVKDELTGNCVEPLGCQPGGPCTTADGVGGRYNADCECIANVAIQGDDIRETNRTYTELPGFSFGSTPDDGGDDKDPIQGGDIDDSNRDYTGIIDIGGFDDDDDDDKDPIKGLDEICAGPKPTSGFALQTYERHCEGGSFNCDSQNRVTREDGSCGECKPGFSFDENFDQCVRDSEVTGTTSTETTETPSSGGGGGGGGMGAGAFAPFLAGISYTPQTLPEIQASTQPDYAQELESLITRQLAKRGMFT
jgi:hypothetical protein